MAARRFKRDDEEEEKKVQAKEEPSSPKTVAADAKKNTAPAEPVQSAQSREVYSGVRSGAKGKVVTQEAWDRTQNITKTREALEKTQYRVTDKNWDKDNALGEKRYNARLARHAAGLYTEQEKQDYKPNGMRVNFGTIKDNDQAVYVAAALYGSDRKAFLKDYAKRAGQSAEDLYKLAESKAGLSFGAMSRSGRLKEIGLMTLDGEDIDFDTAGPDSIVQAIRDIADDDLQKEAIKLWQAETRDKDSRFYGYDAYSVDYSFRDSAVLTKKDYKEYADELSGKFDPSESALEKSLRAYEKEYAKLEARGRYVMRQELPVLQKAFAQQMGLGSAPDIYQVRSALEEADKAKADQKSGAQKEKSNQLADWWNSVAEKWDRFWGNAEENDGDDTQERSPSEATAPTDTPTLASTPSPTVAPTPADNPATMPVTTDTTTRTPAQTGEQSVRTSTPKVEGRAPFFGGGYEKKQEDDASEAELPTQQQATQGSVSKTGDPIGALVSYTLKGKGELLDDETEAEVEAFVRSSPEMMAVFGILSDEDHRAIDTGNRAFNVAIQNTGILGPLAPYAQKVQSRGFLQELSDDAAGLLISIVQRASQAELTREETEAIELGLTNRSTLYLERHPEELKALEDAFALSDEMRLAALGKTEKSAQEALETAQKRCRTGYATQADWDMVYAHAPVTTAAQKRGDQAYNEAVGRIQQTLEESWQDGSTDNWFNAQTLLWLNENGMYTDLNGREALTYKAELQSYLMEAAGAEYDVAYALGYKSLGDYWERTGASMDGLYVKAIALRDADLKAMSEEVSPYQGDGSASTLEGVGRGFLAGLNKNAADNYEALATLGVVTDTDAERYAVRDLYYSTGSFTDAEARCRADLYGMLEGGYFPNEAVAGYIKGYLDNGGPALDLGILPTEHGWDVAQKAKEKRAAYDEEVKWAQKNLNAAQGKAFEVSASTSSNTLDQLESFALALPLSAVPGASSVGKFLLGTMAMQMAYGAPAYLEGAETALAGGADLKGANVMGASFSFAQAAAELYTDLGIADSALRAAGVKDLIGEGLEQAGATAGRRFLYALGAAGKQAGKVVLEEVTHDEFFEGTFTAAAEAGTWKAIELTDGFTELPGAGSLMKIAGAAMQGGLESVGPVTRELITNLGENTIMTLPMALISGGIAGAGAWRSTHDVRRAIQTGKAEDIAQAGASIVEDMKDPQKASAVDTAAQEAHLQKKTADILTGGEGEIGTTLAAARKAGEQADSHQKTYTKSFKANKAAQNAMTEAQAKLDAGDTSEETIQALKDAQEAFAKTRNNMDESWREYQQKKAESDSLHEKAYSAARAEAARQVQQERAELAGKVKAEQEARTAGQEERNALELEAAAWVDEQHPDAPDDQREKLIQRYIERVTQKVQEQPSADPLDAQKAEQAETEQAVSPEDREKLARRDRFARAVSSRFSVNIELVDRNGPQLRGNRGGYSRNGNTIYLPIDATQSDVIRSVVVHELTHRAEESGHYRAMADALLEWKYGDDTARRAKDREARKELYRPDYQDTPERAAEFEKNGDAIAESEQVARIAEELFAADEKALDRLIEERPTVAQRIADTIRNVIRKFKGVRDPQLESMRRVGKYMRKALDQVERKRRREYTKGGKQTDVQHAAGSRAELEALATKRYIKLTSKLTGEPTTDEMLTALTTLADGGTLTLEEVQALPEVADAYSKVGDVQEQIEQNKPAWVTETPKAIEELSNLGSAVKIVDEKGKTKYEYTGEVRQERRLDIVIGPPAAGKSSVLADPLSAKYHSRIIDSDMAKERLSGYRDGLGAGVVHEESGVIKQALIKNCVRNGDNIVLPIIGDNPKKLIAQIENYKSFGYDVYLHLNELPGGKAIGRALNRYLATGRFIDPKFLFGYGDKPTSSYEQVIQMEGLLSGYSRYSNDVELGESPIFLGGTEDLSADEGTAGHGGRLDSESAGGAQGRNEDVQHAIPEDDLIDQQIDAWRARALPSGNQIAERGQQSYGDGERQFAAKTAQQSQAMPDWLKQELLDNPQQHYYEKDSNDAQLMRAWGRIQQDGYEATRDGILKTEGTLSADDIAAANVIMAMAFRNNDMDTAMQMAHRYNVDGTQTAKALQARKLFSRMTPTGMKARVAAQSEAKTAEYMRTHKPAMEDIKKRAAKAAEKLDGKQGGDELLRLNSSGGYVIDGRSSKWGVPINEQQQALIDHYKLGKVARPGLFYNRATTEQRMLEAILVTPNPLELTGNGLNLIERLEMMIDGLAVVTNADLEYIGRNLASYASMDADMQQNRDGDLALSRAYEAFGNIDPATFGEKLRTWSYVSMLLSIPSAERNVIGNAVQNAMNAVSDGLAVELDKLVSLKTGERARAHLNMQERADGWHAFVEETKNTWRDYFVDKSVVLKGEERFSLSQRGRVFQTPALEAARLVEGYLMSVGDRNFWKKKFVNSMAEQMRLAELNGTEFDYDAAVEIAEADANYATFTEDSKIRDIMADLKRRGGVLGWATHFIVPFTGVPTNIAKRQLQFSPLGILKTLAQAGYNAQQGGNFDQRAFVDGMSRGLTGTAMLGIGALLFKAGLIGLGTAADEDDLYDLNTAQGEQYSAFMTVGKENISLSSFMPSAGPLVTGAVFAKLCGEDEGKFSALCNATLSSIDSVLNASYLSSAADFLKTLNEEGAFGAAMSAASSAASQFTPAALSQLATALDPYVRDTKDADAIIAMVKAAQARIPGLRQKLPEKVDITGEAVRSKEGLRNFFDPLTRTAVRGDETLDELERVWRATGGGVSIPGFLIKTSGSVTIPEAVYRTMPGMDKGNNKLTLTSAQRVYYNQMYGQRVFEALRELMDSPDYQYEDDDEKAELLRELNSKEIKEIRQDIQRQICIDLGYDKY